MGNLVLTLGKSNMFEITHKGEKLIIARDIKNPRDKLVIQGPKTFDIKVTHKEFENVSGNLLLSEV